MESSCIYCGLGCRLNFKVESDKILKITGVKGDDVSDGIPCIKGLTIHEVYNKNRINNPLIKKNGKQLQVTLNEALDHIYTTTKNISPNDIFFNTSGKLTNENNYVMQKFARICYRTPNIDSCCGRLCHIATVMGMTNVFGTSNITKISNLNKIDTLFIIGSEPDKDYPVFYYKLMRKKDLKIIRVHSFEKSAHKKEFSINIYPGSETCLLNGIINELLKRGVKSRVEGFRILAQKVEPYTPEFVCKTCRSNEDDYAHLVNMVYNSKSFGIFHGMALTQHVNSLENIHSLLNLVLLKKGVVLSLRGEINVQGVGDLGGIPGLLPTGTLSTKKELEEKWGEISSSKGLNMIEAMLLSPVKALFITEFNPFKSLPNLNKVQKYLKDSFIVYFGAYHNDTSRKADVVIPIASLIESEGTITNGEKRLRKVNKVIEGKIELWQTLKSLSKRFKKNSHFNYTNSRQIFEELATITQAYKKIDVNRLWSGSDEWADKTVKYRRFLPESFEGLDDSVCVERQFLLTTYRSKYSFLGDEITKTSRTLSKYREPAGFYINPSDAKNLKIKDGNTVKVSNKIGALVGKAYTSDKIPKGIIGTFIHYSKLKVNTLFPTKFDEESFTPNYKSVAVQIEKI